MAELNIPMRFVHILSAVALLGGAITWRFAVIPATQPLGPEVRAKIGNAIASAWRPLMLTAALGLLISGTYNFLNKTGLTPQYHAVIGVKFLLALHVFAVGYIVTNPNNEKRSRQLTGVVISGTVIVILSAVLRWL
jgi:hypothetical protein